MSYIPINEIEININKKQLLFLLSLITIIFVTLIYLVSYATKTNFFELLFSTGGTLLVIIFGAFLSIGILILIYKIYNKLGD